MLKKSRGIPAAWRIANSQYVRAPKKGMTEIEVMNYYDENGTMVTIALDPLKTPSEKRTKLLLQISKGPKFCFNH
ncbi:hypothetical protein GCM10020331_046850 [Ectobacillus funiculus]